MIKPENRIIAESHLAGIDYALSALRDKAADPVELQSVTDEFARLKSQVREDLSSGDWGRIGVLAGLLWYKLDVMIKLLGDNNQELRNVTAQLRK